jgi:hypothetical protein
MHPATLELKLKCWITAKLMSHNAAMFTPTTRQMPASIVLAFRAPFFDVLVISPLLSCRDYLGLHKHLHIMYIAKCNIIVFLTGSDIEHHMLLCSMSNDVKFYLYGLVFVTY